MIYIETSSIVRITYSETGLVLFLVTVSFVTLIGF